MASRVRLLSPTPTGDRESRLEQYADLLGPQASCMSVLENASSRGLPRRVTKGRCHGHFYSGFGDDFDGDLAGLGGWEGG